MHRTSAQGKPNSADTFSEPIPARGQIMSALRNMSLSLKFAFAFGIVVSLCVLQGGYAFFAFRSVGAKSVDVRDDALPSIIQLAQSRAALNNLRREDLDLLLCQNQQCIAKHMSRRNQDIQDFEASMKTYEALLSYPGERELYQKIESAYSVYRETSDRGSQLLSAGKNGDTRDLIANESASALFHAALDTINADADLNTKGGQASATKRSIPVSTPCGSILP